MAHALSEVAAVRGGRWSDLGVRLASALILGPACLLCLWLGGWPWSAFILLALGGLGYEWGRLAGLARPWRFSAFFFILWLCTACFGLASALLAMVVLVGAAALAFGGLAAWGIPYAGLGALALLWLRLQPGSGLADSLFLVLVVWGTDIGAYLVGRVLGGPKLAPRISPGKTWSGALGGLFLGSLAGAVLAGRGHWLDFAALPAGLLLSLSAQSGDLLESAIKRKLGVKDSGRTIPGHGGLFDRLDGFLIAAPLAVVMALSVQKGLPLWG